MFKKLCLVLASLLLSFNNLTVAADSKDIMTIVQEAGFSVPEEYAPKSALIMGAKEGEIVWESNIDEVRDPASMSKVMTLYLLFEDMSKGLISPETTIVATETDEIISKNQAISNSDITAGVAYPVEDLIFMMLLPSSNVATLMIANQLSANNPTAFVDRMNAKAQELGMTNTKFNNAGGASAGAFQGYYEPQGYDNAAPNQSTARDMATMTYHFLKNYPNILDYSKHPIVTTMPGTPYEETFVSYNQSLPGLDFGLEGVNGLKTGSSPQGAFNSITTATRGDLTVIVVVMGVGSWDHVVNSEYYRQFFVNALVDKGFIDYQALLDQKAAQLLAEQEAARLAQEQKIAQEKAFRQHLTLTSGIGLPALGLAAGLSIIVKTLRKKN